jgi:hypothetical protein
VKSASRNQKASIFLRMPPEIRNKVYKMVMGTTHHRLHTSHFTWDRLNLSRTCHQIFAETATDYHFIKLMPLSYVVHHTPSIDIGLRMIEYLTPSQKLAIRHVSVSWARAHALWGSKCVLEDFKGLKRLVLRQGPTRKTRSVMRRIEALKEWIGIENLVIEIDSDIHGG